MLFEINELTVHYGNVEILKDISIDAESEMIVTILGANGAGKTTTLKTISGLVNPTRGEIWFQGQRIDRMRPQQIVRIGISQIMEGRHVFPKMSVTENLTMGAFLRKDKSGIKTDLEQIFIHFPVLKMRRKQIGHSLSGGEQQMLAIARALMSSPKLLLMDEPTLGLAPMMVWEIAEIVKNIHKDGVSIILVEQNVQVALNLCHKGYVLEAGVIVMSGSRSDLEANSEYVKKAYLSA